mmetsp:Transcript_3678/g.8084  ORF Transcript_3678/g.8084 Transcript_3678/m.8084 type:complete len:211 (-) Transcript_3678:563-1195(-)
MLGLRVTSTLNGRCSLRTISSVERVPAFAIIRPFTCSRLFPASDCPSMERITSPGFTLPDASAAKPATTSLTTTTRSVEDRFCSRSRPRPTRLGSTYTSLLTCTTRSTGYSTILSTGTSTMYSTCTRFSTTRSTGTSTTLSTGTSVTRSTGTSTFRSTVLSSTTSRSRSLSTGTSTVLVTSLMTILSTSMGLSTITIRSTGTWIIFSTIR